jgi:thioredoxin-like negative regulator of GroEL
MNRYLFAALALLPIAAAAADDKPSGHAIEDALKEASARHAPVFVDFWAPWCHSCFYMQKNVMSGPEWEAIEKRTVVVELDGDEPEGNHWATLWKIGGYPTYVVLDEHGKEIGRILGDRPRAQFYAELNPILEKGAALETLQAQVTGADAGSLAAARTVLKAYYERQDWDGATAWIDSLPAATQQAVRGDAEAGARLRRIAFMHAAASQDAPQCLALAPQVLGGDLDCDRLMEMSELQSCLEKLPEADRKSELSKYEDPVTKLQLQVLVNEKADCTDTRGIVDTAADLYEALGDKPALAGVWAEGIAYTKRHLQGPNGIDYTIDHSLADNLRYYMDRAGNNAGLDQVFPPLIAAYPDTYDYYFRYGRNLVKRGEFAKALPYLEQAADRAYGRNRLWVAQWRAQALMQLDREDDARKVAEAALQDIGPWWQEDVAKLKAVLEGTSPA